MTSRVAATSFTSDQLLAMQEYFSSVIQRNEAESPQRPRDKISQTGKEEFQWHKVAHDSPIWSKCLDSVIGDYQFKNKTKSNFPFAEKIIEYLADIQKNKTIK